LLSVTSRILLVLLIFVSYWPKVLPLESRGKGVNLCQTPGPTGPNPPPVC
jgi:hypothetical protein